MNKQDRIKKYLIISGIILATIVITTLAIVYDLDKWLGPVGTAVANIFIMFGLIGYLEIDDWFLWYKKWVFRKYLGKQGYIALKVYNDKLEKKWVKIPYKFENYIVTNNRTIIFRYDIAYTKDQMIYIYFRINPINSGITITTEDGVDYYPKKSQVEYQHGITTTNMNMIIFANRLYTLELIEPEDNIYPWLSMTKNIPITSAYDSKYTIHKDSVNFYFIK